MRELMELTEQLIKKSCSSTIYKRGMEYFKEGRVHLRKREDNLITAVVDGDELYNVQIKLGDDGIDDFFCTCPYYETMNSMCKHIAATLEQRRAELSENGSFTDENDRLAQVLCGEYALKDAEKDMLHAKFTLYAGKASASYGMSMEINGVAVQGIENFLDCFLRGKEFKFDRSVVYTAGISKFPQPQSEIISILAEMYENRAREAALYTKAVYQTVFGMQTAKRIFPLLPNTDFSLVFDGVTLGRVQFKDEDPDIIVDVGAADKEINISVSDRGFALTPDGEWFLHEGTVYRTSEKWRGYFMPIYRSLSGGGRTQLSFRGSNTILFATHVLPNIRDMHGIVMHGVEDMIVNETPVFEIYFDAVKNGITAAIKVYYGGVSLMLPDSGAEEQKIVVRDFEKENEILSYFRQFVLSDGIYTLYSDAEIYDFLTNTLTELNDRAALFYSERFKNVRIPERVNIRASVRYNSDINLLEAGFDTDLSYEQIYGILSAVKIKRKFYRLSNGRFVDLTDRSIFSILNQLDFTNADLKNGKKQLPLHQALYLNSVENIEKDESFNEYIETIRSMEPVIPQELEDVLRPYQRVGVKWFKQLSALGLGGILADDMGLGKTLQVIAYIHGEKPDMPSLVVTPSALTYNWKSEINRFAPDASVIIIDGTKEERMRLIEKVKDYEFVITSYPIMRRDINLYKDIKFSYCFIDEAQHIKNAKTMNARSVKKINAEHKFALTGTPVENSLMELWSIFDFAMRGYLYDAHEFRSRYEYPMLREKDEEVSLELKAKIKPFILRRMKADVLNELPEKIENTIYADLTQEQKKMYSAYLAAAKDQTAALLSEGGRGKMQILTLLMRLRQICCHPALFDENYTHESGKLELLIDITQSTVESGHRILIFSQFTSMLAIIKEKLDALKIPSFYMDGSTAGYERAELADRFNGGERDVFLISLKAGGTGLNLIGADTVVHYDPWWNPAVTEQASDRAYRIGQTRAVQVIRLAARSTIEEKILRLQERKKNLADDIVRVNGETFGSLTNEEIMALFDEEVI